MKFNRETTTFDGKNIVKASGNKLDAYDGSALTGLKFTQLTDIGSPSGNKVLVTNQNGSGIDYLNINFNAVKEIIITNQNSATVSWNENTCTVEHGLDGYVFIQLYDNTNYGVPVIPVYVDNNHISFYVENKPADNETYKLICVFCGYSLSNVDKSIQEIHNPSIDVSDFGMYLYNISGDEVFSFNNVQTNKVVSFRLYLQMPSTLISFTWPLNILWKSEPDVTQTDSLYSFVFEWNPVVGKWLGNQFWPVIDMSSDSSSSSDLSSSSGN